MVKLTINIICGFCVLKNQSAEGIRQPGYLIIHNVIK